MTNLNKFKSKLVSDKGLQKRMSEASTIKDVVKIAKSVGCDVTENEVKDDMMQAISGGGDTTGVVPRTFGTAGGMGVNVGVGDVDLSVDFSRYSAQISQAIHGDGSTTNNVGNISIGRDKTTNKSTSKPT